MSKACQKCSTNINTDVDLYTICEGRCARWFHAKCVGVSEAGLCLFSKNIVWICDDCMVEFCKFRETPVTTCVESKCSLEAEVNELKQTVAGIVDSLSKIGPLTNVRAPFEMNSTPIA